MPLYHKTSHFVHSFTYCLKLSLDAPDAMPEQKEVFDSKFKKFWVRLTHQNSNLETLVAAGLWVASFVFVILFTFFVCLVLVLLSCKLKTAPPKRRRKQHPPRGESSTTPTKEEGKQHHPRQGSDRDEVKWWSTLLFLGGGAGLPSLLQGGASWSAPSFSGAAFLLLLRGAGSPSPCGITFVVGSCLLCVLLFLSTKNV